MTIEEIVQKFLSANEVPSKYNIKKILGFSAQTLVRNGFKMSEIKKLFKESHRQTNFCVGCSVEITNSPNKYCSRSCSTKTNNSKRKRERLNCLCCGAENKNNRSSYCSHSCSQKYIQDKFIEDWLSGVEIKTTKGNLVSRRIRRYLFEKYDCRCANCGWGEINPVTGKSPLEVEHIDGDSRNNSPENLTLLCPNCHSLTPTYKALNRGKGRSKRMTQHQKIVGG